MPSLGYAVLTSFCGLSVVLCDMCVLPRILIINAEEPYTRLTTSQERRARSSLSTLLPGQSNPSGTFDTLLACEGYFT